MTVPPGVLTVAHHSHCSVAWLVLNHTVQDIDFPVSGDCIAIRSQLKRDRRRPVRRSKTLGYGK